jgi:hypothetical protein
VAGVRQGADIDVDRRREGTSRPHQRPDVSSMSSRSGRVLSRLDEQGPAPASQSRLPASVVPRSQP